MWKRLAVWIFLVGCFCVGLNGRAAEEEELLEIQEVFWDELELDELDEVLTGYEETTGLSFSRTVKGLMKGEIPWSFDTLKSVLKNAFLGGLRQQKETAVSILLLIIGATVFTNFAGIFEKSQVSDVCYYVIYLLLFSILIRTFYGMSQLTEEALLQLLAFMELLMPAYLMASLLSSRAIGGTAFYELILGVVTLIQWAMCYVILPAVNFYVLLTLLNQVTGEENLSKMAGLLKSGVEWVMKTLTAAVIGIQAVQGLILPVVDNLKNTILQKSGGSIPVIGGIFNNVTEVVLGSAMLIRNGIGTAGLLVLIVLCLVPLGKLFAAGCLYRVLAAGAQPVADKHLAECLDGLGQGIFLLLRVLLTTGILFFLSMALAMAAK